MGTKILIAGFGNLLRGDDGFGVTVVKKLSVCQDQKGLPDGVKVMEVGISGVSLVQELMNGYDWLIVVDAVDREEAPGTVFEIEPSVKDLSTLDTEAQRNFLGDMHFTEPSRAMALARALGVLPKKITIMGCQPTNTEELEIGLSPPVENAVAKTIEGIRSLVQEYAGKEF